VDIQRVGAQELDVNVVPADVFEQDKTDPKNPVLRLRDWLLDILSLRVASATLTNATISQATISQATISQATISQATISQATAGSVDITTLTTPTVIKVANLNADLLDGYHAGNSSSNVPISNSTLNTNLNADQLDGYHAGNGSGNVPISNGTTNTNLVAEKAITAWELKLQTVSASTALQSDVCIVEVTTSDAVALTIPAGLPIGHQYRIKRTVSSANGISVARSGSETIEGLTSFTVQDSKVSATLDTGEVVIEKMSSTAWSFVGGQVSGSNSNGTWIKFSGGMIIATYSYSLVWSSGGTGSAIGFSWNYPVSIPYNTVIFVTNNSGWSGEFVPGIEGIGTNTSSGFIWQVYGSSTSNVTHTLYFIAEGRWK
jgi:hypothetical protein